VEGKGLSEGSSIDWRESIIGRGFVQIQRF
jgi:hypothetical protein